MLIITIAILLQMNHLNLWRAIKKVCQKKQKKNVEVHCNNSTLHKEFHLFELTKDVIIWKYFIMLFWLIFHLALRPKKHIVQLDFFLLVFSTGLTDCHLDATVFLRSIRFIKKSGNFHPLSMAGCLKEDCNKLHSITVGFLM